MSAAPHDAPTPPGAPHAAPAAVLRGDDAPREIAHAMTRLVEGGFPIAEGLRALAAEVADRPLQRALAEMAASIDSGASLADAFARHADLFPRRWAALFQAGVRSGHLSEMTAGLIADQDLGKEIARQMWATLLYPCAVFVLCAGLFGALGLTIGRHFGLIFRDFGISAPWGAEQLFALSDNVINAGFWPLIAPVIAVGLAFLAWRFALTSSDRGRVLTALPLIGPIHRYVALCDLCRTLSWLLRARLPMTRALEIAAEGTRNPTLADACATVAAEVSEGRPLGAAIEARRPFPPGFAAFVAWASGLPQPAQAIALAASIFEARARAQGRFVAAFIAVFTLALALWWTFIAVFVVLYPLTNLLKVLSG